MHVLYVTAHATVVALQNKAAEERHDRDHSGVPIEQSEPWTIEHGWAMRFRRMEGFAHSYIRGRYTAALTEEALVPADDPGRLQRALVTFDIAAHRALANNPSAAEVTLITQMQALTGSAALRVLPATWHADPEFLHKASKATESWATVGSTWHDLIAAPQQMDRRLVETAGQLRAALREVTHDHTQPATTEVLQDRPTLTHEAAAFLWALEQGDELAEVVAELGDNPDLTGPARVMSHRAQNLTASDEEDIVWVHPRDIQQKKVVPLPRPVADHLNDASRQLLTDAHVLGAASARLSQPNRGVQTSVSVASMAPRHERITQDLAALHHNQAAYAGMAR